MRLELFRSRRGGRGVKGCTAGWWTVRFIGSEDGGLERAAKCSGERTGNKGVGEVPLLRSTSSSSKGITVPAILTPPFVRAGRFRGWGSFGVWGAGEGAIW